MIDIKDNNINISIENNQVKFSINLFEINQF